MAYLRVLSLDGPQGPVRDVQLDRDLLSIGRDADNALVLEGNTFSRHHARVQRTPDGWVLEDLGSSNGTLVRGVRISKHVLQHGDMVQLGDRCIVFYEGEISHPVQLPSAMAAAPPASYRPTGPPPLPAANPYPLSSNAPTRHANSGTFPQIWLAIGIGAAVVVMALGVGLYTKGRSVLQWVESAMIPAEQKKSGFKHFIKAMEGMEARERGQGDETTLLDALGEAEHATLLDPSAAPYWHLLGYIYAQFKNDTLSSVMAEDSLQKALTINPDNVASRLLLARLLMERESYSKALDQLEWVGKENPKWLTSSLTADMCRAYVVDKQVGRGEAFFQEALKVRPGASSLRLAVAILLHEKGRTTEGLQHLSILTRNSRTSKEDADYAVMLDTAWRGAKS